VGQNLTGVDNVERFNERAGALEHDAVAADVKLTRLPIEF
jgi:hypothetical protein